jgi:ribonucleoside-diphosphate reductase alpha chain
LRTEFTNDFSEEVWASTYKYHKDKNVDDTLMRVAKAAASVEKTEAKKEEWTEKFYDMLGGFKNTSGGRIYANAGTDYNGVTLLNCYVGPEVTGTKDSLDGILKVLRDQAQTLKSEGGWGYNFSFIRPRGAFIYGVGVETPGAVRYMELFDKSSDIITSGSGLNGSDNKNKKGKIRKGAMMSVLDCAHPDVIEFIQAKQTSGRLSKFNMSVNCTDEFMNLVAKNDDSLDWDLIFPETTHPNYDEEWKGDLSDWIEKGYPVKVYKTVKVQWLWNLIMESTYNRAEPGVLFLDRANDLNELNYLVKIVASNPLNLAA